MNQRTNLYIHCFMSRKTYNAYRIMWIIVMYDLPTETKKDRKEANQFRKKLLAYGFQMFQFSMYIRHSPSKENSIMHTSRVKGIMPTKGKVCIFTMTDKQFGNLEIFYGQAEKRPPEAPKQLLLF